MSTAVSLVEQVRSRLQDYGNGAVTLAAAVVDTAGTTISLSSVDELTPRQFLLVDTELLEVIEIFKGSPDTATVLRGARGSTAATHTSETLVRIDPVFGFHEYLRFLNQALSSSFPSLYKVLDDHSTTLASGVYEYAIPNGCDLLARVEIETYTSGVYEVSRQWDYVDKDNIIIEEAGRFPPGRAVRFLGYQKFDHLTPAGSLDADYPKDDANCLEYLVLQACSLALRARQAPIARRDSFIGVTDSFQQSQPFMSTLSAKDYERQAQELLRRIRMPRIPEYVSDPGRVYYGR